MHVVIKALQLLKCLLSDQLEMLEVLARLPVTTPLKACLGEELEAEVVVVYLIWERFRAVTVFCSRGRLDEARAVGPVLVVGVVERIDVYCQPPGMLGELGGAGDGAEAEAR